MEVYLSTFVKDILSLIMGLEKGIWKLKKIIFSGINIIVESLQIITRGGKIWKFLNQ